MTTSTDTTALDLLRAGTAPKFVAEATGMAMSEVVALAEVHGLTPGAVQVPVVAVVPRQRQATPSTAPAPAKDNTRVSSVTALLSWARPLLPAARPRSHRHLCLERAHQRPARPALPHLRTRPTAPRNVQLQHADGHREIRPFRGLPRVSPPAT